MSEKTEENFVEKFKKKVEDKGITTNELLELLGTPFDPHTDTPDEYDECVAYLRLNRPGDAWRVHMYISDWNCGMANRD